GIVQRECVAGVGADLLAVDPEVIVLELGGPVGSERPFDAGARHPAALRVRVRYRYSGGEVVHARIEPDKGTAALGVEQPVVGRDAETAGEGRVRRGAARGIERSGGAYGGGGGLVVACESIG